MPHIPPSASETAPDLHFSYGVHGPVRTRVVAAASQPPVETIPGIVEAVNQIPVVSFRASKGAVPDVPLLDHDVAIIPLDFRPTRQDVTGYAARLGMRGQEQSRAWNILVRNHLIMMARRDIIARAQLQLAKSTKPYFFKDRVQANLAYYAAGKGNGALDGQFWGIGIMGIDKRTPLEQTAGIKLPSTERPYLHRPNGEGYEPTYSWRGQMPDDTVINLNYLYTFLRAHGPRYPYNHRVGPILKCAINGFVNQYIIDAGGPVTAHQP